MKIAWCTPFTVQSAIGGVGALAVEALRRQPHTEVDIWYPAGAGGRTWPDRGRQLGEDVEDQLAEYDRVVYNIGDHAGYHGAILKASLRVPGVVVLHDLSVVHLVFNSLLAVEDDYFVATMQRWYGDQGRRAALEGVKNRGEWAWRPETVQQFPLTEVALEGATSVVTHSQYAADALTTRYVGEVSVVPLPVRVPADEAEVDLGLPEDRLIILQAGVLNPNKHVPVIVEAIAKAGLAEEVHLVVCGHTQPRELQNVRRLIDDLDLGRAVTVLGEVSDATLQALRTRADIATVLRHPCGEAASAVLAETLGNGLPVVTVDDGCYREAPDEAVLRVAVPPEPTEVGAALRRWVDDAHARARAANIGRTFVAEQHSPEAYATALLAAVRRSGSAHRRAALAQDLAAIAARAGFGAESSLVDRLAERAHELFGGHPAHLASTIPPDEQLD